MITRYHYLKYLAKIDYIKEWLMRIMDDGMVADAQYDLVLVDDDLTWDDIIRTSGAWTIDLILSFKEEGHNFKL